MVSRITKESMASYLDNMSPPKGRALTNEQKRLVMERVLAAWCEVPELRLGQLLVNACGKNPAHPISLFYIEDTDLADLLESWRK